VCVKEGKGGKRIKEYKNAKHGYTKETKENCTGNEMGQWEIFGQTSRWFAYLP
jgi:hypothetical protein